MLKIPPQSEMADRAHFAGNMTQQRWLGAMKNLGCVGCHQLGQLSTRTIPASLGTFRVGRRRLAPPRAVGPGRRDDARPVERARRRVVPLLTASGPIASRKASCRTRSPPAPARCRAQHRRHAARLDGREALPPRSHLERSTLSDRERQRTARTDRRSTAPTSCRFSTRRRTRRRRSGCRCAMRRCRSASGPATPRR